jgi:hypothetical protein
MKYLVVPSITKVILSLPGQKTIRAEFGLIMILEKINDLFKNF